jgi:16S rRNA (cytosine967-C5)-methyltransferase
MPDWLYEMFERQEGTVGAHALAMALMTPAPTVLRVNTLRASREEALRALSDKGVSSEATRVSPFGIELSNRADLRTLPAFKQGMIEVQDEASQLTVLAAHPRAGERVLDACAGAGGKSLMLAMLLGAGGEIVAEDLDERKLTELRRRAKRAGARGIHARPSPAPRRGRILGEGLFDLVVVDAPCSGTGTLRRSPDLKWRLDPETINVMIETQVALLTQHAERVREGGRLAYMTCSILRGENEDVVRAFLRKHPEYKMQSAAVGLAAYDIEPATLVTPEGFLRTDPRKGFGDGFFTAVFLKP